jgi:hypothetical protein
MPKSTIQMSPGFAAGIFGFLFVHVAEAAADGGTLFVRQLGQFGHDFNRTHDVKLTPHLHAGKRGFEASLSPGGKSADGNLTTDETDNGLRICWSRK